MGRKCEKNDTSLIPEIILVGFQTIQILTIVVSQLKHLSIFLSLDLWDPVEPPIWRIRVKLKLNNNLEVQAYKNYSPQFGMIKIPY